ncbi:MAG: hypothetical protein IIX09_03065, partial [Clostridia bacterium]|nr:hypothetical protein [Clostridia bacterium]
MKKRHFAILLCFLMLTLPLASCTAHPSEPQVRSSFDWFDTVSTVYSYAEDTPEEFLANYNAVAEVLSEYHRLFDIYYEYSGINNLCTVNRMAGKEPVKVKAYNSDFLGVRMWLSEVT